MKPRLEALRERLDEEDCTRGVQLTLSKAKGSNLLPEPPTDPAYRNLQQLFAHFPNAICAPAIAYPKTVFRSVATGE